MGKITVEGQSYKVVESGGYNQDIGKYWKRVQTPDGEKMVVGSPGRWRFWTAADRTRPLREAIAKGWPKRHVQEEG